MCLLLIHCSCLSVCFYLLTIANQGFPKNKNTLHLIFPGKSLVCYHLSHCGCSDYATNGLPSALSSSSGDING